jgi:hypothetical protein
LFHPRSPIGRCLSGDEGAAAEFDNSGATAFAEEQVEKASGDVVCGAEAGHGVEGRLGEVHRTDLLQIDRVEGVEGVGGEASACAHLARMSY